MNMIDIQDKLKGLSEQQLVSEMQSPSGGAPQFLVLSEITRRKRMRDSFQNQQAQPTTSIAEEAVASAGVPSGGLAAMARSLAPNSSMAQNTAAMPSQPMPQEQPVQGMYGGGYVQKMAGGMSVNGQPADMSNPMVSAWVRREAQRRGVSVEEVMASLGPTGAAISEAAPSMDARNRMLGLEPSGPSNLNFPTQSDLDQRYADTQRGDMFRMPSQEDLDRSYRGSQALEPIFPDSGFSPDPRQPSGMDYGRPLFTTLAGRTGNILPEMPEPSVDLDLTSGPSRMIGLEPQGGSTGTEGRVRLLKSQVEDESLGAERRIRAAQELEDLRDRISTTQFGGGDPSSGISVPEGYMMTAMGLQLDPNYMSPGKTGIGMVDQAAGQGSAALSKMDGVIPDGIMDVARRSAQLADYEKKLNPLNLREALIQGSRENSFLTDQLRREMDAELKRIDVARNSLEPPQFSDSPSMSVVESLRTSGSAGPQAAIDNAYVAPLANRDGAVNDQAENSEDTAPAGEQPKPPAPPKDTVPQGGGISTDTAGVPATPNPATSAAGRGAGAAVGGSNAPTSYEQELRDAMVRAEKRASQDKWLALAQVGMQLMSSKEPTLGGALGEAGIAGLQSYRGSRDAYENERLGLTKSLFDLQQQQAAAAAAQRAAGAKAAGKPLTPEQRLKQIEDRLKFLVQGDPITGETIMQGADGTVASLRQEYINLVNGGGGGTFDATAP